MFAFKFHQCYHIMEAFGYVDISDELTGAQNSQGTKSPKMCLDGTECKI